MSPKASTASIVSSAPTLPPSRSFRGSPPADRPHRVCATAGPLDGAGHIVVAVHDSVFFRLRPVLLVLHSLSEGPRTPPWNANWPIAPTALPADYGLGKLTAQESSERLDDPFPVQAAYEPISLALAASIPPAPATRLFARVEVLQLHQSSRIDVGSRAAARLDSSLGRTASWCRTYVTASFPPCEPEFVAHKAIAAAPVLTVATGIRTVQLGRPIRNFVVYAEDAAPEDEGPGPEPGRGCPDPGRRWPETDGRGRQIEAPRVRRTRRT